jgi:hypothetical protein
MLAVKDGLVERPLTSCGQDSGPHGQRPPFGGGQLHWRPLESGTWGCPSLDDRLAWRKEISLLGRLENGLAVVCDARQTQVSLAPKFRRYLNFDLFCDTENYSNFTVE